MVKTITVQEAKKALKYLKTLVPANPKLDDCMELSIKEAVIFMAPDLTKFSRIGFTHKELADGLSSRGIAIKSGTLNRYLSEYLASHKSPDESESVLTTNDAKIKKSASKAGFETAKNPKPGDVTATEKSEPALTNQEGPDV